MPPFSKSLLVGEKIRRIRKHKGWSIKQLANKVGVSFSYIAKIETGQNRVNIDFLYKVAKSLRVTVQSLLPELLPHKPKPEKEGWYALKDFYVVHFDYKGRPERIECQISDREANLIGQIREIQQTSSHLAQIIFTIFENYADTKNIQEIEEIFLPYDQPPPTSKPTQPNLS
ncbi:MAG: XRE family transcriptional regulator [Planctomycetota bacterium]|nr:MAG: XRE family transcriptional regulator [Planctomycetota bacterium]